MITVAIERGCNSPYKSTSLPHSSLPPSSSTTSPTPTVSPIPGDEEERLILLQMISDTTLTHLSNGLGVAAMLLIVGYHFVAVNARRASA